jgi:hypothetical protein
MPENLPDHWGKVNFFPAGILSTGTLRNRVTPDPRPSNQVQPAWLARLAEPGWAPGVALVLDTTNPMPPPTTPA